MNYLLNDGWKVTFDGENWFDCAVPCSMYSILLKNGLMDDPFYRENEWEALKLSYGKALFIKHFNADKSVINKESIILEFEGVDTIAEITLNSTTLGLINNMHRSYSFDVRESIQEGENILAVKLYSSLSYIEEESKKRHSWAVSPEQCIPGYQYLRKAHYMFGWDWGPKLPDMGLFRDVKLTCYDDGMIQTVYFRQRHQDGRVYVNAEVMSDIFDADMEYYKAKLVLASPNGEIYENWVDIRENMFEVGLLIENPRLWWPNGYGKQPLYNAAVYLYLGDTLIDSHEARLGLRTLTVSREKDKWGEEFCFVVNGVKIFSMGADYVPEDNILSRTTRARTERLLRDCTEANFNTIRVWGGGYYPEDWFYDLCDTYGLIVWQDFMFACGVYELTNDFERNITLEVVDNLIRMRNHPCLGLLCGNNEMEWGWVEWDMGTNERLRLDHIYQYERLFPELMKQYCADTFYWPASPSSGGGFDNPNDENRGDVHFWEAWHGSKSFTVYREHFFRFCSEFGFEALPSYKTICAFTEEGDRNLCSPVMENHQKFPDGNKRILQNIADWYLYPSDFKKLTYVSQLVQADAIRFGVEHMRRYRGRCMGAVYWQLNDCWPCVSWSSIDWYGRWKALHYAARRFFAPVMLSLHDEHFDICVSIANEGMKEFRGRLVVKVLDNSNNELTVHEQKLAVGALSSSDVMHFDAKAVFEGKENQRERVIAAIVYDKKGAVVSEGTFTFARPKHFSFLMPTFTVECEQTARQYVLTISSDVYAKGVYLDYDDCDCVFSDNFFDLYGQQKIVTIDRSRMSEDIGLEQIKSKLRIMSVYDIR